MGWFAWIVLGGFAGWVASLLTKRNAQMGIFMNVIVGIVGALAGSWIMSLLGANEPLTFSFQSFLIAVGGAVLLLVLFSSTRGRSRR